jgi:hypothetical protein
MKVAEVPVETFAIHVPQDPSDVGPCHNVLLVKVNGVSKEQRKRCIRKPIAMVRPMEQI